MAINYGKGKNDSDYDLQNGACAWLDSPWLDRGWTGGE